MQRKSSKKSRGINTEEKSFMSWIAEQPCIVTGRHGVHVHHCIGSSGRHNKVLIGHWFCLPLTPEMHSEYHNGTKAFRDNYGTQSELWKQLADRYTEETGKPIPYEVEQSILDYHK